MEKGLISVVVPIYKVEKYLDNCISSIVNQTYQNLEILLIDDGSPDNCPRICDEWVQKDGRIKVIHKENQGLGMARNTGIEHATGEYICFFDSDDSIAKDTIQKAYHTVSRDNSDVVIFGFYTTDEAGMVISSFAPKMDKSRYTGSEVQEEFLPELIAPDPSGDGTRRLYMSACMMLFSLEMIQKNNWRFISEREIISEDVYSLLCLFQYVDSVCVLPEALYYYRTNVNSLSRVFRPDRYHKVRHFYLECKRLCEAIGYNEDVMHRLMDPYVAFTISAMKSIVHASLDERGRRKALSDVIYDEVLQSVLRKIKDDEMPWQRKALFFAIRGKWHWTCRILLWLKR